MSVHPSHVVRGYQIQNLVAASCGRSNSASGQCRRRCRPRLKAQSACDYPITRLGRVVIGRNIHESVYMFQRDICAPFRKRTYCEQRTNSVRCDFSINRGVSLPRISGHMERDHEPTCPACRRRFFLHGQVESSRCRALPDRAGLRQGLDHEARQERQVDGHRHGLDRLARARHRARRRRPAARPGGRDLRAGILRQDHARAAHPRGSPEEGRHLRLHRCRARARSDLRPQARREGRRPADLAARRRRAGARNRRHAGALRRDRRAGDRLRSPPSCRAPSSKARWATASPACRRG